MMYSKLLLAELRRYNTCRVVVAKQPAKSYTPILSLSELHSQGIHISEDDWQQLKLDGEQLHFRASIHLFSVEEELQRVPKVNSSSVIGWRNIQRAVYVRGRRAQPTEILTVLWHSHRSLGDRLCIFPLRDSFLCEGVLCSYLAWKPIAECGYGKLKLIPRMYLFTADTWIGFCEK